MVEDRRKSFSSNSRRPSRGEDSGPYRGETISVEGALDILPDYGVLRSSVEQEGDLPSDVYVSLSQIRRLDLRMGDMIEGVARPPKEGERYLSLLKVTKVAGTDPEEARKRPRFERLTILPCYRLGRAYKLGEYVTWGGTSVQPQRSQTKPQSGSIHRQDE